MKTLNNIFRNTLPALATAAIMSLSLTSCDISETGYSESLQAETAKGSLIKTASYSAETVEAHFEEDSMEFDLPIASEEEAIASISILKAEACYAIEGHEPLDPSSYFGLESDKVWIYSKVKMEKGAKGKIHHVYIHEGKEVQTVTLKVKGPTFRTNSYKTINANMEGDWKVEIRDDAGNVLDTVEFNYSEYNNIGC